MIACHLVTFWIMQVAANVVFKFGSGDPRRRVACFVLGNAVGASSIYFAMKLYERMNPNLALAIAGAGAFMLSQVALASIFRSRLTVMQWVGIAAIAAGTAAAVLGGGPVVTS